LGYILKDYNPSRFFRRVLCPKNGQVYDTTKVQISLLNFQIFEQEFLKNFARKMNVVDFMGEP
jgi:hypothetical protein